MTKIAVIGSGPAGYGTVEGLLKQIEDLQKKDIQKAAALADTELHIFDQLSVLGVGAPYTMELSDPEHLLNVRIGSGSLPSPEIIRPGSFPTTELEKWINDNSREGGTKDLVAEGMLEAKSYIAKDDEVAKSLRENPAGEGSVIENVVSTIMSRRIQGKLNERFVEKSGDEYERAKAALIETEKMVLRRCMKYCRETKDVDIAGNKIDKFYPRFVYGIHAMVTFEQKLQELAQKGIKVVRHEKTEALGIDEEGNLAFQTEGQVQKSEKFDEIVLASGTWPKEEKIQGDVDGRHIKTYPASNIHTTLSRVIEMAKAEGRTNVRVAVKGGSLSGVDAIRSVFSELLLDENYEVKKPATIDGVKVHLDVVSRGGDFQKVRSNAYKGKVDQVARYWTEDGQVPKGKTSGDQIVQEKIDALKDENGVIHLGQILELLGETLQKNYTKAGNLDRAKQFEEFLTDLRFANNKEKYPYLTEKFFEILAGTKNPDPLKTLEADTDLAENGDGVIKGDVISSGVYQSFESAKSTEFLPLEERIFRNTTFKRLNDVYATGIPIQSAREIVALGKAGLVSAKALGYDMVDLPKVEASAAAGAAVSPANKKTSEETVLADGRIALGGETYDMVIEATGLGADARKNPSKLSHSLRTNGLVKFEREPFCTEAEFETKCQEMSARLGKEAAAKIISNLEEDENKDRFYCNGKMQVNEKVAPFLRLGGVNTSIQGARKVGQELAKEVVKNVLKSKGFAQEEDEQKAQDSSAAAGAGSRPNPETKINKANSSAALLSTSASPIRS